MRILVTGSEGYVGAVLVPILRARGHRPSRLDSGLYAMPGSDRLGWRGVDRRDIRDLTAKDLEGFDALIHLAALSNDPLADLDPGLTREINHQATVALARGAKRAGVRRFVFVSSCSVYGASGVGLRDERGSLAPLTPYAESKARAEEELRRLADRTFEPVILRPATAYGLSPMMRFDLVVNDFIASAHATGTLRLRSDGRAWRPLVHVEDIARALTAATEAEGRAVAGETFNVGRNGENIQILALARSVEAALPGCKLAFDSDCRRDGRCYRVDFTKARLKLPGFRPRWTARRGVIEIAAGLRHRTGRGVRLDDPPAHRLAYLKRRLASGSVDESLRVTERWPGPV